MSSPGRRLCSRVGAVLVALLAMAITAGCGSSSSTTSTAGSQSATAPAASTTSASGTATTSRLGKDARAGETCDRFDNDGRRLDTDRVAGA